MEPYCFTIADAALFSGIGRSKIYTLIGAGRLEAKKLGARTLVSAASLRKLLDDLPDADINKPRDA
jgi:excisionase family DNA binding protein